jgi:hypothetical protein
MNEPLRINETTQSINDPYLQHRRPFIHDSVGNVIHVGPKGAHHFDIHQTEGIPYNDPSRFYKGYLRYPGLGDSGVGWYPPYPENRIELEQALTQHFPEVGSGNLSEDGWEHLSADQMRLFNADVPEVIVSQDDPYTGGIMGRKPIIYNPHQNKVYLGSEGKYHAHLMSEFPESREAPGDGYIRPGRDYFKGFISLDPDDPYGSYNPGLDWYADTRPDDDTHERVKQALIPYEPAVDAQPEQSREDAGWGDWAASTKVSEGLPRVLLGDLESPDDMDDYEGFNGRRPVLWRPKENTVYLGNPNTYHSDLHGQFDLWGVAGGEGFGGEKLYKGYAGGGKQWGGGPLGWYYGEVPADHEAIAHALQQHFPDQDLLAPIEDEDEGWDW